MFWRLHGNAAPPSAPGSNTTAEAAPGAVVTQIGMYLCCLRMFALSLRGCAVGMSCCYNPDHVLSAGTLSKCFSNAHGTGSQWSRRPGMIHRLLRAVDKVPCAKHCRWRWPAVSCAAAARSRRAQLALCRQHALERTGKQSWHAAAEPYTPHGNGLDETSTAAMEAVLRHRKPEKISPPEAPCQ